MESAISSDNTSREKQETMEDKTFDKLSDLNISKSKDLIKTEKDTIISKIQEDSMTAVKHISDLDAKSEKLLASEDLKRDGKKVLLDDGESKASKQSDNPPQTISSLKENVEDTQVTSEEKASTKQISSKIVTKESSAKDAELKEDKDLNKSDDIKFSPKIQPDEKQKTEAFTERSTDDDKYLDDSARGKSADLSSTESRMSMLNVEESLSPERTGSPRDKKLERIKRNGKERPETEIGKSPKYIKYFLNISKIIKT